MAPIQSYPIFIGFNVGNEGLTLEYTTINVKNEQDQQILDLLNSDVFRSGVKLVATLPQRRAGKRRLAQTGGRR
jgi:hypothetical protein